MAIRKELATLYSVLLSHARCLPARVQTRTLDDIESLFKDYDRVENPALLADILSKAQNKLTILEMSLPSSGESCKPVPGRSNFIVENGQLKSGAAEKKQEIEFSNWYAGNVDPADLRRHKELLERQHYGGPFWENRKRNPSILDEPAPERYPYVKQEERPPESLRAEKESAFEEVKR